MFGMGMPEMLVIAGLCILIFGPRQLPKFGKAVGDTIRELRQTKRAITDAVDVDDDEPRGRRS